MTHEQLEQLAASQSVLLMEVREAFMRVLTGGNHLASALIGWLGADEKSFPPYTASHEEARAVIRDVDHYDAWCCWRAIMQERPILDRLPTPPRMF